MKKEWNHRSNQEWIRSQFLPALQATPAGSRIAVIQRDGQTTIALPAPGLHTDFGLMILLSSVFLYVGAQWLYAMAQSSLTGAEHYWLGWPVGGLLTLIGAGNILKALTKIVGYQIIEDKDTMLIIADRIWGVTRKKVQIAKATILDILVTSSHREGGPRGQLSQAIRARLPFMGASWQTYVEIQETVGRRRFADSLSDAEKQWLVDVLRKLCGVNGRKL